MTLDELFETYPNLIFYDFEAFKQYWCVVVYCKDNYGQVIDTQKDLRQLINTHRDAIFVGFNNRHYDKWLLAYAYDHLGNLDDSMYDLSQKIIVDGIRPTWSFNDVLEAQYDCILFGKSLKKCEAFMGESIEETTIPFDYEGEFTDQMKKDTHKYCQHDVFMSIQVFIKTISNFTAQKQLIETFKLPRKAWSLSKAQLTAMVLGCNNYSDKMRFANEEWDTEIFDWLKPLIKHKSVISWFEAKSFKDSNDAKYQIDISGVPHVFGLGGIHGAIQKCYRKGKLLHVDVTSYYPSIMIEYNLLTRATKTPEKFKEVYDTRVALKKAGKKVEQAPYKIILNSTYGILNDKYSSAYDPKKCHEVCINGQLMLLLLIEMLEGHCDLIQSNTDGLIIDITNYDESTVRSICDEWMSLTKMGLGFDEITEIWQKDVNNYVFKFANGEIECKGAYVKYNNELDNDMPIVNDAVRNACLQGGNKWSLAEIAITKTIFMATEMVKFQKVFTRSDSYKYIWWNDKCMVDKCYRVFASKDKNDSDIRKQRDEGKTKEKIANTPPKCKLVNGSLKGVTNTAWIDNQYYIDIAIKRAKEMIVWV